MISPVNAYEQLVCARILDFLSSASHWNRGLWNIGTILALQEVLEASEAQRDGHLSGSTIRGVTATAIRLSEHDPGLGTVQERNTLLNLLRVNGEPRDELLYEGLEYEAISELVQRTIPEYLRNWALAVSAPGPQLPPAEKTARAIAGHMLDAGFYSDFLHRWWTRQIKRDERNTRPLSEVLNDAAALVNNPEGEFTVLVTFP